MLVLAGTGSRSLESEDVTVKGDVYRLIREELLPFRNKPSKEFVVMSGMAEGFDKLLAVVALELNIKLWCAIPNKGYGKYYWGEKSLTGENRFAEYLHIVKQATYLTYVMEEIHNCRYGELYLNGRHANFIRNDFMVKIANEFLVWEPTSAGTKDCLKTIKRYEKPFKILNLNKKEGLFN